MKINSLTQEQISKFPIYVEKWINTGLATGPVDLPAAKKAVKKVYEAAGLDLPKKILVAKSPIDAIRLIQKEDPSLSSPTIFSEFLYGNQEAGWLSFYSFFKTEVGIKECEKLDGLIELSDSCGWWSAYKTLAVLQDRPMYIHRDDQHNLHSTIGPAIEYSDGYAIYSVHGVIVEKNIVMEKEKITVKMIENEPNAEVRRVMTEFYGISKYLNDSGAVSLDCSEWGILWKKPVKNDEPILMVEVLNSTPEPKPTKEDHMTNEEYKKLVNAWKDKPYKTYFIEVHPELRPLLSDTEFGKPQKLTAKNAIASTFGLRGEEYQPSQQS